MTEEEYQKHKTIIFNKFRLNNALDMLKLETIKYEDIAEFTDLSLDTVLKLSLYSTNEIISETDLPCDK